MHSCVFNIRCSVGNFKVSVLISVGLTFILLDEVSVDGGFEGFGNGGLKKGDIS